MTILYLHGAVESQVKVIILPIIYGSLLMNEGSTSNCCANETATTSTNFGTLMLSTITRTVSGTSEATVTATSFCASSESDAESSHTSTVTVGAGVGASLGALLLASTATLIWRERTHPKAIDPLVQSTLYDLPLAGLTRSIHIYPCKTQSK